jgi:hypothetical protein
MLSNPDMRQKIEDQIRQQEAEVNKRKYDDDGSKDWRWHQGSVSKCGKFTFVGDEVFLIDDPEFYKKQAEYHRQLIKRENESIKRHMASIKELKKELDKLEQLRKQKG